MFIAITFILAQSLFAQPPAQRVRQPREVVEAYRVCQQFQDLMARIIGIRFFSRLF